MRTTQMTILFTLAAFGLACGEETITTLEKTTTTDQSLIGGRLCLDTCEYANDGVCDDGQDTAITSACSIGTDCGDCGPRYGQTDAGYGCDVDSDCENQGLCIDGYCSKFSFVKSTWPDYRRNNNLGRREVEVKGNNIIATGEDRHGWQKHLFKRDADNNIKHVALIGYYVDVMDDLIVSYDKLYGQITVTKDFEELASTRVEPLDDSGRKMRVFAENNNIILMIENQIRLFKYMDGDEPQIIHIEDVYIQQPDGFRTKEGVLNGGYFYFYDGSQIHIMKISESELETIQVIEAEGAFVRDFDADDDTLVFVQHDIITTYKRNELGKYDFTTELKIPDEGHDNYRLDISDGTLVVSRLTGDLQDPNPLILLFDEDENCNWILNRTISKPNPSPLLPTSEEWLSSTAKSLNGQGNSTSSRLEPWHYSSGLDEFNGAVGFDKGMLVIPSHLDSTPRKSNAWNKYDLTPDPQSVRSGALYIYQF